MTYCNARDGTDAKAGILTSGDFLSFPLSCFFQTFASVIPNIFFCAVFLFKIHRYYYVNKTLGNTTVIEDTISSLNASPTKASANKEGDKSAVDSTPATEDKYADIKRSAVLYFRILLKYCAYIQSSFYFLYFFTFIGDARDYTSGLLLYWLTCSIAWVLCGICMKIDLEDKMRFRFSAWPGRVSENYLWVSMIGNGITAISTETASYENRTSGAIIVVVSGILSTFNCVLFGFCILRESLLVQFLFEDELYVPSSAPPDSTSSAKQQDEVSTGVEVGDWERKIQ